MNKLGVSDCFIASILAHGEVVAQLVYRCSTGLAITAKTSYLALRVLLGLIRAQTPAHGERENAI